jgi:hypothetical protein
MAQSFLSRPSEWAMLLRGPCSDEPEWIEVYEQCKETAQAQFDKVTGNIPDSGNEQARTMAESMGNMAISMADDGLRDDPLQLRAGRGESHLPGLNRAGKAA